MGSEDRPRVLLIDGVGMRGSTLQEALSQAGMETMIACGDQQGLELFFTAQPDLVLLGTAMPVLDPWEICRRVRSVSNVPIVVLADKTCEAELLHAFSQGADEYLAMTANPTLLVARAEALLQRTPWRARRSGLRIIQAGDIYIDMLRREVRLRGRVLPLSRKKLELLACLVRQAGQVVSYRELLRQVWGGEQSKMSCLAVYIRHLRCCIEEAPDRPKRIVTVRGLGYRFIPSDSRYAPPPRHGRRLRERANEA